MRIEDLNLTPVRGKVEPDINPCTRGSVGLYKETLNLGAPLSPDELMIFKDQFKTLLAGPGSEERRIQLDRLGTYVVGLRAIKHELGDQAFVGMQPEDTEVGFGHIRPIFIQDPAQAANTGRTVWTQAVTTAYADYVADSGGAAQTLGDSFGLVITHLLSLVTPTPFTTEMAITIGRKGILIPIDTRALVMADNVNGVAIIPIPTIIVKPKATFLIQIRGDESNNAVLALRGLLVGFGRALKATTTYPTT